MGGAVANSERAKCYAHVREAFEAWETAGRGSKKVKRLGFWIEGPGEALSGAAAGRAYLSQDRQGVTCMGEDVKGTARNSGGPPLSVTHATTPSWRSQSKAVEVPARRKTVNYSKKFLS